MRYHLQLLGMVLAVSLCLPLPVFAVKAHETSCNNCHRSGANPRSMANVCTPCHERDVAPIGRFTSAKASDALGSHPNHLFPALITGDPGDQTSHFWGGSSSLKSAAGSTYPLTTFYSSRYSISTKRVTCSMCHDPHKQLGTQLVRATTANDLICKQCHTNWFILNDSSDAIPGNDTNALLTHPIVADYATFAAANSLNYQATPSNSSNGGTGEVRLVNGGVSCTSCHGVHFTDSDSSTIDGRAAIDNATLAEGDGHLLRADGPGKANKSALCQSCHTYQEHGKVGNNAAGSGVGDVQIGCLVCHSGHSYDATAPNFFVLRKTVDSGVAGFGSKTDLLYTTYPTSWATYCVSCHGPVTGYSLRTHSLPADSDCTICHAHNATTYSFAQGSSGTACSSCHGAPPRIDTAANRVDNTVPDTGYAVGANGINYRSANQNGKDESTTPHKRHAGALNEDKVAVDYAFGSGSILNACLPCHNDKEDAVSPPSPTHDKADSNLSFQDVYFNTFATYSGVLTAPLYKVSTPNQWTCSGIYCHSNGGKRRTDGAAKAFADFKTATTPAWPLGSNNTTNIGTIVGIATECQQCHGENRASMLLAEKNNSATHDKHLLKFGDGKTKCYLCHSATVDSTGTIPAAARDHRLGGTHVNGAVNVVFSTTAFGGDLATGTYASGATQGTCVVYCHSDAIGGPPALVPDWDFATGTIVCGSCHGITAATLTSNSHAIHINSAKADVSCNACHGAGATTGTHAGHVDGLFTKLATASSCDPCHGIEVGDTSPVWGNNTSIICASCHVGATVTSYTKRAGGTVTAPAKNLAATVGHNRPTASGAYPVTGKPAGNKQCTACHLTTVSSGHVDGLGNGDLLVVSFSCESCHTAAGSRSVEATVRVKTHSNTDPTYTLQKRIDFTKACLACHDPHGTSNGGMVESAQATQNAKDATGNFAGDVVFSSLLVGNSFDEADSGAGVNNDDICATCHSTTLHNNRAATVANHHEGENCTTTCHGHNGDKGGFMPSGGNFCNDCHGNPPTLADDRPAGKAGVHAAHVKVASHDASEDKFDCDICHPGAGSFTLSHTDGSVSLAVGITNGTCSAACHYSGNDGVGPLVDDGYWTDTTGLNCDSCHYWSATPTSGGNVASGNREAVSASHNKHFDKGKVCVNCHTNNATDTVAPRIHITDHEAWTLNATNDGTILTDRGNAIQDEATVDFTLATTKYASWNDTSNSCGVATANSGLGCHASGAPTWGGSALGCIACHTDKSTSAVNPTSGLHSVAPLVSGVQHDESFLYNSGLNTGNCETCHTTAPSTGHQDGVMDATRGATGNTKIAFAAAVGYIDAAQPTCAPSLTGCHYEQPVKIVDWRRKWHEGAANATGSCAGCHGDWVNGWNANVQHHTNAKAQSTHGTKAVKTYECVDCHALEASTAVYPFTIGTNDWRQNAAENTTLHGNGAINVNSTGTGFLRSGGQSGCPTCHANWATDGKHAYTQTEWTLATVAGDAPTVTCATCHGGLTVGASAANYWPDKVGNDGTEDNVGRHAIHMTRLAQAKYGETITTLLSDNVNGTADVKQRELCSYCHASPGSDADHGDVVALPAEVNSMYNLWNKGVDDASYSFVTGDCSNVNCHNGKATSAIAGFTWYGASAQNCALCHNDITVTTAATTGATHDAHVGTPITAFGKAIACASCHGGSPTWSPYVVPSSGHINGAFSVSGGNVTVSYTGIYTNAATRTVGSCGVNLCHNNGKNAATPAYTWQTAIAGCAACHATSATLGSSHDPHMNASFTSTFRSTVVDCTNCHAAASASSMAGMTAHMDGTVNIAGVTYTGNLAVNVAASYGTCSGACHVDHLAAPKASPSWNRAPASGDNCTVCHASPPADGRHAKHMLETDYVTGCGNCHSSATVTTITSATHFDGSRNTAGTASVVYTSAAGTCTNSCHKVTDGRDWTSGTQPLACTDCHQAGTIAAGKGALPVSGLHNMTAAGVQKHDATLGVNGCKECHVTPGASHLNNIFVVDSGVNDDRFLNTRSGLVWADGAANSGTCFDNGAIGAGSLDLAVAGCHRDNGVWKRLWSTNANVDISVSKNPGQLVCDVCHGQYQSLNGSSQGWREGSVHYRSGGSAAENKGVSHNRTSGAPVANACDDCHAYPSATGVHENGALNFSGGAGVPDTYTVTWGNNPTPANQGWYCATCHAQSTDDALDTTSHTFPDSTAFATRTYVVGLTQPEGGCTGCHGNSGTGGNWPDGSTGHAANQGGQHAVHALEIAKKLYVTGTPSITQQNTTCNYCHPANSHGGVDAVLPADVSRTDSANDGSPDLELGTTMKKIIGATADSAGFWRRTPGTCSAVACHAGAPFTPHWYADTTAPGNVTLYAEAGPVPRSIRLYWDAPGDDDTLDGTAYKYDMRMATNATDAANFDLTTNYVQGVPTVTRTGKIADPLDDQQAIIHNVNPSTTYYFSLRTYDRNVISNPATTVYGTSNTASYVVGATPDTAAPVLTGSPSWYGLDSAKALDTSGTIKLSWTRAEDHSMPITYDIWWSTGTITYGAPQASTQDTSYRVTGRTDNQTYNFAVRAKDFYNNTDTNTIVLQAIPQGLSEVPKTSQAHFSGTYSAPNVTMNTSAYTGTAGSSTLTTGIYFIAGATYHATASTNVYADTFSVYISNTNSSNTVTAELGYYDTAFRSFTTTVPDQIALTKSVTLAARAKKVAPFKFGEMRWVPGGKKLAVKLTQTAAGTVNWGTATNRGDLTTQIQPINVSPTPPTITTNPVSGANVSFYWTASTDSADGVADAVHYDVYGSANGGTDGFPYVIATGLTTNATSGAPLVWDTQAAGILASSTTVQVRVEAGDTISGKTLSHTVATSGNLTVDNSGDNVAPGAITNFKAETRPKQGAVALSWTAPGDDGGNNGRAASYDIRWSNAVIDTELKYTNATQLVSEPYPDFGGNGQGYEALGLADGTYYFAIKAVDEGSKTSPLAYTTATTAAGPKCGICHSTPPDESASIGNHAKHGFTMAECGNCHGTEAATFTTAHQDGAIKLGWKTATPAVGVKAGYEITYTQGGQTIYQDASPGGFNVDSADPGDKTDSGSCSSWSTLGVSGCHGPATSASWTAAATLPCSSCHGVASRPLDNYSHSFDDPSDDVKSAPPIDNHGYDGLITDPEAERKYVGAHVSHLNASFRMSKGDSCRLCHGASRPGVSTHADGIIDVKLDIAGAGATATWTPGTAITAGTCGSMDPSACHPSTATPKWDSNETFYCTNCHGMGGTTPSHVTDPNKLINLPDNDPDMVLAERMPGNCVWCHIGGHPKEKKVTAITQANPAVVTTENNHNLATNDKVTIHTKTGMTEINNKTYLVTVLTPTSFSLQTSNSTAYTTFDYGTWIEGNGTGIILVQNDSRAGINYLSGGVHLKANIGARGEVSSEAELCWSCHFANSISEWGADSAPTNATGYQSGNGNIFNFGALSNNTNGSWYSTGNPAIGATWTSANFSYKTLAIRSTHSTDPTGTSALTGSAYNYSETIDPVGKIRCSNCHDVHNLNKAPNDNPTGLASLNGPPYLRGTWRSSPYKEDGAPQAGTVYTAEITTVLAPGYGYGPVPRANNGTAMQMGGYWIDQNSGNPTAGWSYETSAGLCQLCHGNSVDALNYAPSDVPTPENLWISATNGHANSVLGGSGSEAPNIFKNGITSGVGRQGTGGAEANPNPGVWMGFQITYADTDNYGEGPRANNFAYLAPLQTPTKPEVGSTTDLGFAWGVTVDATTIETGYHQFSCSKCHNPHASRLPKLMISNCLDVTHNTWDNSYDAEQSAKWASWQTTASSWGTQRISHLSTAQNCHRYVDVNGDNVPDESGWNKVTPW